MALDKRKPNCRRTTLRVLLSILALLLAILLYHTVSSLFLRVETVSVRTKVCSPIRIVQLTDLHNAQFGKNNQRLVEKVALQNPDLIFLCGDMLNSDDEDTAALTSLISELSSIAPVY